MKPMTAEWIAKAEGDFAMMERKCRVADHPNYDGIFMHSVAVVDFVMWPVMRSARRCRLVKDKFNG